MNLVTCTQCGASKSHYDPETGFIVCDYCGAGYTVPDEPRDEYYDFPTSGSYFNLSASYIPPPSRRRRSEKQRPVLSDEYFRRLGTRIDIPKQPFEPVHIPQPKYSTYAELMGLDSPKPRPRPKRWWNSLFERKQK